MFTHVPMTFGCDPEGFFLFGTKPIGSERVIPEAGLGPIGKPLVIRDGVQFELNPTPKWAPSQLSRSLQDCFILLRKAVTGRENVYVCLDDLVEVEREELNSLSERSRILGCSPSLNVYGDKPITVNPLTYMKRTAAGHLHLGLDNTYIYNSRMDVDHRSRLVPHLDIFVGNTCVLLDRSLHAVERRLNYGRAGEYRLPPHGLEYRVPSNFWLRHYALMSLVFDMAIIACSTLQTTLFGQTDLEEELIKVVNLDRVIEAIDTNNYDLARENFDDITPFLKKHLPTWGFQLNTENIPGFLRITEGVCLNGIRNYWPQDPIEHWVNGRYDDMKDFISKF